MIKEWYSMSKAFNGTDRLQLFGLEIIALISQGKVETIEEIEKHIDNCDLVQYVKSWEMYRQWSDGRILGDFKTRTILWKTIYRERNTCKND